MFEALFSLSQSQRRLSHENNREALKYEADGNLRLYRECRDAAKQFWRDAKWHLRKARDYRGNINPTEH